MADATSSGKQRRAIALSLAVCFGCSCAMTIQPIDYGLRSVNPQQPGPGCAVRFVRSALDVPDGCVAVGDVFIGDAGLTIQCGEERVVAAMEREVCKLGGELALIRRIKDRNSSCYQARSIAYHCAQTGNPSKADP